MKRILGGSLLLAGALSLSGCGDDPVPVVTCNAGEQCACDFDADCPMGETCDLILQVCVAGDVDAGPDAGPDATDSGSDATDVIETPDADVVEPDADTIGEDVDDVQQDTDTDVADADVTDADADVEEPDADVSDATDGSAETDTGPDTGINDPWVLWEQDFEGRPTVAFGRVGVEGVQVIELPLDEVSGDPLTENAQPSWSHDGTEVIARAFVPGVGFRVRIFDLTDGTQEEIDPNSGGLRNLASPSLNVDATRFVVSGRGADEESTVRRLFVVDRSTGAATAITPDDVNSTGPVWLADGRIVFNCDESRDPEVCIVNSDGTDLESLTNGSDIVGAPGANGDATLLAWVKSTGINNEELVVYNVDEDEVVVQVAIDDVGAPSFSPDGRYVTFSQANPSDATTGQDLGYTDVQSGTYLGIFRTTANREQNPHFGPVNSDTFTLVLPSVSE